MRFWLPLLAGLLAATSTAQARTKADLILSAEVARPGDTVMAGVRLKMPVNWHTYWRNPGSIGLPTKIDWQDLPPGITAGDIQWPLPHKSITGGEFGFDYDFEVVLLVPLKIAANAAPGTHDLNAKVSWLECETNGQCVPGRDDVSGSITIGPAARPSPDADIIVEWQKKVPPASPGVGRAFWEKPAAGETRPMVFEWPANSAAKQSDFYPYRGENFELLAEVTVLPADAGKVRVRKQVKKEEGNWPQQIAGVLVHRDGETVLSMNEVNLPIAASAEASPLVAAAGAASAPAGKISQRSLPGWLFLGFLGGLILNIMPCVLPVIALKILGFVNQSHESPARVRQLGLIYCLGVLFSFLLMAGVVISVQQAGKAASWGMQFQNPVFLVFMTILVLLVALNLFGVFEVMLGGGTMTAASELAGKEGGAGAFFNGMLATALATPCTAPFLAPALGFAFAQPPATILLMFAAVGAGLAAPYVALSWNPAWLKFLPKPGGWMVRFKVAMGFPMLGTAIWMFWLTIGHYGNRGVLWFGLFLVMLALAAWVWGEFVQRSSQRRGLAMVIALALLGGSYAWAMERELDWRTKPQVVAAGGGKSLKHGKDGVDWQAWSPAAEAEARSVGRPVLIDFTADWCATCQLNKKTSIEIKSVRAKLKEINAAAFLGDYTHEDAHIAAQLKKFGRAGVPLVLVYPKNGGEPIVLPEALTPGIVLDALERASK